MLDTIRYAVYTATVPFPSSRTEETEKIIIPITGDDTNFILPDTQDTPRNSSYGIGLDRSRMDFARIAFNASLGHYRCLQRDVVCNESLL